MIEWVEFFVEEPSAEAAMRILVPKIRPDLAERFEVHAFQGVTNMMAELPQRLKGYAHWLPSTWRIVVVRDEDRKNCVALKREIEAIARRVGLSPKRKGGAFQVMTRLAVEELEAWFFGDVEALAAAFPGVPRSLNSRRGFRDPDAITGGTWEAFERILQTAGHFPAGLAKIQAARDVATHMVPERNVSKSFKAFRDGLLSLG